MQEYHEPVRCRKCGGRCCQIYLPKSEGGMFPADKMLLPQWHAYFHENKAEYGVSPLFNPLEVHASGNETPPTKAAGKRVSTPPTFLTSTALFDTIKIVRFLTFITDAEGVL